MADKITVIGVWALEACGQAMDNKPISTARINVEGIPSFTKREDPIGGLSDSRHGLRKNIGLSYAQINPYGPI